jgi:hypothetical protein
MVVHSSCALCKAPFHKNLYDLFGLHPYMPVSWECNPENTPDLCYLWGDDLVWSWQLHDHSYNKSNISSQFGWENDHKEIVRVCQKLVGIETQNQGKRNLFYQCFNGYWDEKNKRFEFGQHPDGWMWNEKGERIYHGIGIIPEDIHDNLTLSTSKWLKHFKGEVVDYLLDRHFPKTLKTLERLKCLKFLKSILEVDGTVQQIRLQVRRRLVLGKDEVNLPKVPIGRNDNEARPSGMANATV